MFSSTVLFSIKLTGTFMNLEFSTINYNTNKCRIHLHSGREKSDSLCLHMFLYWEYRAGWLHFFFLK